MGYNTKYMLRYCNSKGDALKIELQLKDYIGETFLIVNNDDYVTNHDGEYVVLNIDGKYNPNRDINPIEGYTNPFTLRYRNDIGEKGGTIRATEANMSFYEDILFNIDDLATSDETAIRCIFSINDEIEWIGFIVPDFFSVEITENPVIDLTGSDRIGILKDLEYDIDVDNILTLKSDLQIIQKILKDTGLELNINILCDIECQQISSTSGSVLNHVYVSEKRFMDGDKVLNCYDVLKSILDKYNCLFTQYKGEWWIVNKQQLELGGGKVYKYDINRTLISSTPYSQDQVFFNHIDVGGFRTIIPAGGKNTYSLGVDSYPVYPENGDIKYFKEVVGQAPTWLFWEKRLPANTASRLVTTLPVSYNSNGDVVESYETNAYGLMVGDNALGSVGGSKNYEWVYQSKWFKLPVLDSKKMSFDVSIKAVGKPGTSINVMIIIEFPNSFYKYAWLNNENGYYFNFRKFINDNGPYNSIDDGNPNMNNLHLGFEDKYGNNLTPVEKEFKFTVDAANGQNQNFDLTNSKMMVRVYPNQMGSSNMTGLKNYIKSISINFRQDNQDPKGVIYQSVMDGNFTKKTEEKKVLFGDYQSLGQNGFFYPYRKDSLSIQYNNNGEVLKNWRTAHDYNWNPLLVHSLRQLALSYGKAHEELAIGFEQTRINPFAIYAVRCLSEMQVEVQEGDLQNAQGKNVTTTIGKFLNNKKYILVEGTIDYLRSQFNGKLAQVITNGGDNTEYIYSDFGERR